MATYKYASGYNAEHEARAVGRDLSVSMKHAVNVCNMLRGKPVALAKKMLEEVTQMKRAVPYTQYNRDLAHRKGDMMAGRYPIKVSQQVLTTVKSAESNALDKGLNGAKLIIKSISVQKASAQWHYGRHRGRHMKRAHVEIVVAEGEIKKKEAKPAKKAAPQKEAKPAEKKPEAKPAEKKQEAKAPEAKPAEEKKPEAQPAEASQDPKESEKKEEPKKDAPAEEAKK